MMVLMVRRLARRFQIEEHGSTLRREVLAGLISFVTGVYIVVVNAQIMAQAGVPLAAASVASAVVAGIGSLVMGFWANSPLMLLPGLGDAALFAFSLVQRLGLSWQEALGVVTVTGLLFAVVAFTPLAGGLTRAIPESLKGAISAGVGLFLAFIGLRQGGLIVASSANLVALGDVADPRVILTLVTLLITVVLYLRRVRGAFLISIAVGTLLAALVGQSGAPAGQATSLASYGSVAGALSLERIASLPFWVATFSLTMVVLFENLGMIFGLLPDKAKFERSLQANALAVTLAGLLGGAPTVAAGEGAAGIAAGGRTGLTAITAGALFLLSLAALPVIGLIPSSAVAPVLILVGALMCEPLRSIPFHDPTEGVPAFLVILMIPLTFSVADGIAFGFLAYPVVKAASGRAREVGMAMYIVAGLFLLYFIAQAL